MKVLFAAAEVAPFSKAGGLADVVGSLPKYIEKKAQIAIFTPLHGLIDTEKWGIKELENSELWLTFGNQGHKFRLFMCKLPGTDINVFFVHNDWYFTCFKEVYPKWLDPRYEHERYIAFSLAVMEYAKLLNFRADIIHANDWHTAMIPVYLHSNYRYDEYWQHTKTVFEIHNLAYQGVWFEDVLDFANMRKDIVYNEWGVEHYGKVNWMKGAINYSDRIVAVSPTYAREILTGEYGEGMDYTLRGAQYKLRGILNGIDYDAFNPKKDKTLIKNYDVKTLKYKEDNKKAICEKFGLEYNPERPLIACITRLVPQKGIDLIRNSENAMKDTNADYIFLGSGNKDYENLLIWLSNNSKNIRAYIGYNGELANQIYAASDFYLMPSKFEPCGLSQLIAMRYGSLPIVRATGGLEDTVTGYPLNDSTGFKFWTYNGFDMMQAVNCAIEVYKDKYTFNAMRKTAMEADFSWKKSSEEYLKMYKELANK
ncbi:MAG: glycogen/starch synthase [Candidatus Gastranaerophilaceae bacterium]|nr:glycogen/starch synthase [Candidatus Gastranaerophilaceae bacterium]